MLGAGIGQIAPFRPTERNCNLVVTPSQPEMFTPANLALSHHANMGDMPFGFQVTPARPVHEPLIVSQFGARDQLRV